MKTSLLKEFSKTIKFLKRVNFGLGSFIVSTQGNLSNLPQLEVNKDFSFTPMDKTNSQDKKIWLDILNDAFDRNYCLSDFDKYILKHPIVNVIDTMFLSNSQGEVMGVTSLGVFHKNPNIGVSHYIAIRNKFQGQKLGYYIVLNQYHWLANMGIREFESETTLERKKPIFLHFTLGFKPKYNLNYWNTQNLATKIFQKQINKKLEVYYEEWELRNNTP